MEELANALDKNDVDTGKRLAIWNAQKNSIREQFAEAAKANSDEKC